MPGGQLKQHAEGEGTTQIPLPTTDASSSSGAIGHMYNKEPIIRQEAEGSAGGAARDSPGLRPADAEQGDNVTDDQVRQGDNVTEDKVRQWGQCY